MRFTLGDNVKYYRNLANLTQEKSAETVGVSTQFIKQIETHQENPDMETFSKICEVLNILADYLLLERRRHFQKNALAKIIDKLSELNDVELQQFVLIAQKVQEYKLEKESK